MVSSENVPVAMSCTVVPLAIEGLGGVTAIEVRIAESTLTEVEPDTPACVAVIVAVPVPVPVSRPLVLTVAIAPDDEVQVTEDVRFCALPSEKIPVAVSCRLVPWAIPGSTGVIVSDCKLKLPTTLSEVVPMTGPATVLKVAETVELPWVWVSASPVELIVATAVFDELQVTKLVRSRVSPSLKVPVAVNC